MGQKIHPIGFRLAVTRNWTSRWYAGTKTFAKMLQEDIEVRDFLKKKLAHACLQRQFETLNILALLPDNYTGARTINGNSCILGRTLNHNPPLPPGQLFPDARKLGLQR